MGGAHVAMAWLSVATLGLVVVVAVALIVRTGRSYQALDRALLLHLVAGLAAGLAGIATAATQAPPRDALHVLYGALVPGAPLAGRLVAARGLHARRDASVVARWVALGTLVAAGATLRSFMTGT